MKSVFACLAAAIGMLTLSSTLANKLPMHSTEDAIETSNASLTLPGSDTGTLFFKDCTACNVQSLHLTDSTRFYLIENEVTFAEFKKLVEGSSMATMTVFHPPGGNNVTRIVAMVYKRK